MWDIELSDEHKKTLLKIARDSITRAVYSRPPLEYRIDDEVLNKKCGAFVTLHIDGNLRGCIGNIVSDTPLWLSLIHI